MKTREMGLKNLTANIQQVSPGLSAEVKWGKHSLHQRPCNVAVCVTSIHLTGPCDLAPLNSGPCFLVLILRLTGTHYMYSMNLYGIYIKFNDIDITLSPKFKKTPAGKGEGQMSKGSSLNSCQGHLSSLKPVYPLHIKANYVLSPQASFKEMMKERIDENHPWLIDVPSECVLVNSTDLSTFDNHEKCRGSSQILHDFIIGK